MPLSSVVGAQSIVKPGVCTSSTKPASPFDGQVIYMTDVDQTAVWDGSSWVGLERTQNRNIVINGAMNVDQRATTTTATGYTVDRFYVEDGSDAVVSSQRTTDVPTGQGFTHSLKCTATTAGTATSTNFHVITQFVEGLNSAHLAWGSSGAKTVTMSFWVKASVAGQYSFTIYNDGATRIYPSSYTINSANTWERKVITIPGETTGTWLTNTNRGLFLNWYMMIGSTYLGAGHSWNSSSIYGVTGQANAFSAVNNFFAITGVQLEVGAVATPFEFEHYGTTFAKCQRYYETGYDTLGYIVTSSIAGYYMGSVKFAVEKRATPTMTTSFFNNSGTQALTPIWQTQSFRTGTWGATGYYNYTSGTFLSDTGWIANAEL